MRLFAAILLPDSIKAQLLQVQDLLHTYGNGNFTRPENLHLTLAFLGETQQEDAAIRAIRQADIAPFTLRFSVLGHCRNYRPTGAIPTGEINGLLQQVSFSPNRISLMESTIENQRLIYKERFFRKIS